MSWIKLSDYAKMYGINYRTAHNHYKQGKIEAKKVGKSIVVKWFKDEYVIYSRVFSKNDVSKLDEIERKLLLYTASKGYKVKASYRDSTPLHKTSNVFIEVLERSENIIILSRSQVSTNVDYLNALLKRDKRELIVIDEDQYK